MPASEPVHAGLRRRLTLPLLTFYGLGTIVGAGIYVLIGAVAGRAGLYAPMAFLLSALIAALTAHSYAELSARFPKSAGEAVYVREGFGSPFLAGMTGIAVIVTGVVSAATIANGFAGYLGVFVDYPTWLVIVTFTVVLCAIATWGILQSVMIATVITLMSIAGLLVVVSLAIDSLSTIDANWQRLLPPFELGVWTGITFGAFLAFYAFIGFEDMVNVAEEVKDPRRTLPLAIYLALILAAFLYVLVALVAVLSLDVESLATSEAPLVDVVAAAGNADAGPMIAVFSLLSVTNSALAQIIMASRIIYGMSRDGALPACLVRERIAKNKHADTRYAVDRVYRNAIRAGAAARHARRDHEFHHPCGIHAGKRVVLSTEASGTQRQSHCDYPAYCDRLVCVSSGGTKLRTAGFLEPSPKTCSFGVPVQRKAPGIERAAVHCVIRAASSPGNE